MKIAIVALVLALLVILVNGDNPCRLTNEGVEACQPSVTGQNPVAPPSNACCAAVSKVDLKCLCFYKNNYPWLLSAYHIDPDLAMQLPVKCKVVGESFHC